MGEYHDVQGNTLLLAEVFKNFWNMCLKIYELDPAKCISAPGKPAKCRITPFNWYLYVINDRNSY